MNYHSVFLSGEKRQKICNICASGLKSFMPLTSSLIRWIKSTSRSRFLRCFHLSFSSFLQNPSLNVVFVCDECRSRRNDPPAIWKSLPIPALRFASSVSIIHKQNRYSDTASLIFSRRSSRKHGEFSIDPLIAAWGRRGTSANQMAALSPPWWWTASTSDVRVSDGLAVSLSHSRSVPQWDVQGEGHTDI